MGQTAGFRQAKAGGAGEQPLDSRLQADPVTYREKQWLHPGAGAYHGADWLSLIQQGDPGTPARREGIEVADEPGLGHPQAGPVTEHPEMTGQTEATRVGQSLTIAEQQIRQDAELIQRRQNGRHLAEGKQSGEVGKTGRDLRQTLFQQLQFRKAQYHDRRPRHLSAAGKTDIDAGNPLRLAQTVLSNDQMAQTLLYRPGLLGRTVPGVEVLEPEGQGVG